MGGKDEPVQVAAPHQVYVLAPRLRSDFISSLLKENIWQLQQRSGRRFYDSSNIDNRPHMARAETQAKRRMTEVTPSRRTGRL